jgi:hypothetical protein
MKNPILKRYEQHWFTLRDAKFVKNLKDHEIVELEKVYNEIINPDFRVNKFCGSCVAEMISILYRVSEYDKVEEQFTDAPLVEEFIQALDEAEIQVKEEKIGEVGFVQKEHKKRGRKKKS